MFAFDDFCPHAGGSMHRGELVGLVFTCPLHGWQFDLGDQCRELHGLAPLPMHPMRGPEGMVQIFLWLETASQLRSRGLQRHRLKHARN